MRLPSAGPATIVSILGPASLSRNRRHSCQRVRAAGPVAAPSSDGHGSPQKDTAPMGRLVDGSIPDASTVAGASGEFRRSASRRGLRGDYDARSPNHTGAPALGPFTLCDHLATALESPPPSGELAAAIAALAARSWRLQRTEAHPVPLHRGLLQSASTPLDPRLQIPGSQGTRCARVRSGGVRKLSGKSGEAHNPSSVDVRSSPTSNYGSSSSSPSSGRLCHPPHFLADG